MVKKAQNGLLNSLSGTVAIFLLLSGLSLVSCKNDPKAIKQENKPRATVPRVNVDSAVFFIQKQLNFGVRVPGTEGHIATKDWIVSKMKSYGADVQVQQFKGSFLTKTNVDGYNIIASINPKHNQRVLLMAHWDTRLIAEKDKDPSRQNQPIPGAVDGASGVAALLEIARSIQLNPIDIGVDFIFFDMEDQGENGDNWCLGSKYWAENPHKKNYNADFGILLDLIGAKNSTYGYEAYSYRFAGDLLKKVWSLAGQMGYGHLFQVYDGGGIMDDHYYVNTIRKIPTIDIIETNASGGFGAYHHTHDDNYDAIDPEILRSIIQVVTAVLYKTSDGTF